MFNAEFWVLRDYILSNFSLNLAFSACRLATLSSNFDCTGALKGFVLFEFTEPHTLLFNVCCDSYALAGLGLSVVYAFIRYGGKDCRDSNLMYFMSKSSVNLFSVFVLEGSN